MNSGELSFDFLSFQEMSPRIDPQAFRLNETARNPEIKHFIEEDQDVMQSDPYGLHLRLLVGPSNDGKTTVATHVARVNETDSFFKQRLMDATRNEHWRFLGLHLSLSQSLEYVADKYHKDKAKLNEPERAEASEVLVRAVAIAKNAFKNHPGTVGLYADVVGITESDLGRFMVEHYIGDRRTRGIALYPNDEVETLGRQTRNQIAEYLTLPDTKKVSYPTIDEYLKSKNIDPGTTLVGREEEYYKSSGDEAAFKRHWQDIYTQMVTRHEKVIGKHPPSFERFISDECKESRFLMYKLWIPERMKELGAVDEPGQPQKMTYINNPYIKGIHTHFDRLYGKKRRRNDIKYHHFPLHILSDRRAMSQYSAADILQGMRRIVIYEK